MELSCNRTNSKGAQVTKARKSIRVAPILAYISGWGSRRHNCLSGCLAAIRANVLRLVFISLLVCPPSNAQSLASYGKAFLTSTWNAETLWEPAISAGWSNYVTKPAGFGTGAEGYGYHFGVSLTDNVNGKFMRDFAFAAASARRDDYGPLGCGSVLKRIWNAVKYTVTVSPQASSRTFNWSGIPASLASAGLSNVYQPAQQRTWSATFERAGISTAGYVVGNVWLEFTKEKTKKHTRIRVLVKSQ